MVGFRDVSPSDCVEQEGTDEKWLNSHKSAYAPFGDTAGTGARSAIPFQFTGRENDGMGLYYYRARYYDLAQDFGAPLDLDF